MREWIEDHEVSSFILAVIIPMTVLLSIAALINSASLAIIVWVCGGMLLLGAPLWILLLIFIGGLIVDLFGLEDRQLPPHPFNIKCPCIRCTNETNNRMFGIQSPTIEYYTKVHSCDDGTS